MVTRKGEGCDSPVLANGGCTVPPETDAHTRIAAYVAVEFKLHHEHLFALELERKALIVELTTLTENFVRLAGSRNRIRTAGLKSERDDDDEVKEVQAAAAPLQLTILSKKIRDAEAAIEANLHKKASLWAQWS